MLRQAFTVTCLLIALGGGLTGKPALAAKHDKGPCGEPPDLVSKTRLPEKAKKIRAAGTVAISIGEDGNVVDAKVLHASSDEAGKLLIDVAKGMKFKPRPGCGPFKTKVNFNLAE